MFERLMSPQCFRSPNNEVIYTDAETRENVNNMCDPDAHENSLFMIVA